MLPFLFTSCKVIVQNVIGNHLVDMHYAPQKQTKEFYTSIPFRLENGNILLKVKVNNSRKDYNFMFDTGATTMISNQLINELDLKNGITIVSKDAFNNEISGMSYLTSLKINDLEIKNLRINSVDSVFFSKKCNQKIDGIIGPNVLNQGYYYFNILEKKLVITNIKDKLPLKSFQTPARLKRFMGQPYLQVRGFKKKWLKLDTGYANGFILLNVNSEILNKEDKLIKQKYSTFRSFSSEIIKTVNYYNRKVIIGNEQFLMPIEQFSRKSGNGNIGSKIVEYNNVIIDVPNKKFYILKNSNIVINDSIANINFRFKNDKIIVGALTKDGNLEKRGIRMNDTISKINNKNVKNIKSICAFDDFKNAYINNIFPLQIEIEKNNQIEKYMISKKDFYD